MGKLLDNINAYFENTPDDVFERDWNELSYLDEIGPDAMEYINNVYWWLSNVEDAEHLHDVGNYSEVQVSGNMNKIETQEMYFLAA